MFVITEKEPNGKGSVKHAIAWVNSIEKGIDKPDKLWLGIIPDIKRALKYEFSQANPNTWPHYKKDPKTGKSRYLDWKRKHGYPDTIGIMTGALKKSLTDTARYEILGRKLRWESNPNELGYKERKVGTYAGYFNKVRKVFKYTKRFLRENIIKEFLKYIDGLKKYNG